MREILNECITSIRDLLDKIQRGNSNYEAEYRKLLELKDSYKNFPTIHEGLAYTLDNFSKPECRIDIIRHISNMQQLSKVDAEILVILGALGLDYNGGEFIDLEDILSYDGQLLLQRSHPMFKNVSGDPTQLMYVHLTDNDRLDIYEDLEDTDNTHKTNGFVYVLMIINKENYIFGVNRRENIIIFSSLVPIMGAYRIKNKGKVDRSTYKGLVFPNYKGQDKYVIGNTIVDREFLIGSISFLESLGVPTTVR